MVGAGTARTDDPLLTARDVERCRQPLRVVVGRAEDLPAESALVRSVAEGPVLVVGGDPTEDEAAMRLRGSGVEVVTVACGPDGRPEPRAVAHCSPRAECRRSCWKAAAGWPAPGGTRGLSTRSRASCAPRWRPAPSIAGHCWRAVRLLMGDALALREVQVRQCGPDVLMTGYTGDVY